MNGDVLIAIEEIHVMVANTNVVLRNSPSGSMTHASVAHAATASSVSIPAAPTARRWRRSRNRHASLTSVLATGNNTWNATPKDNTRQQKQKTEKTKPKTRRNLMQI